MFDAPSNWRSRETLPAFLARHGVPAIAGLDTRALVRRIRDHGFQTGVLSTDPAQQNAEALVERARKAPDPRRRGPRGGRDLPGPVRVERGRLEGRGRPAAGGRTAEPAAPRGGLRLRREAEHPAPAGRPRLRGHGGAGADDGRAGARARAGRGVPLERPGRPGRGRGRARAGARAGEAVPAVRHLPRPPDPRPRARRQDEEAQVRPPRRQPARPGPRDRRPATRRPSRRAAPRSRKEYPLFGICLGHQILGLALGGTTTEAQVRPPRRQPARQGPRDRQGRDLRREPRLRGRGRLAARGRRARDGHARQPERRHRRGPRARAAAAVLRAVPPGGVAGPARRPVLLRALPRDDAAAQGRRARQRRRDREGECSQWSGDVRQDVKFSSIPPPRRTT